MSLKTIQKTSKKWDLTFKKFKMILKKKDIEMPTY